MSEIIQIESEEEIRNRLLSNMELNVQADLETRGVEYVVERIEPSLRPTLKVKRLTSTATLPTRGSEFAIGLDLYFDCLEGFDNVPSETVIFAGDRKMLSTGIAVEIPAGFYGHIAGRSGLAHKHGILIAGGIIDSDYRGGIKVILFNSGKEPITFKHGDRIAQLIAEKADIFDVEDVSELSDTVRAGNGFGSSGK